ncbi:hypothetical protein ACFXNW_26585 [Nocardia sp. NPDC059180]|uniref:hypothetical protein n=1 Tax=Nocardia sp. NPDC059180 TaxID=3346761 RepID=UPI0036CA2350
MNLDPLEPAHEATDHEIGAMSPGADEEPSAETAVRESGANSESAAPVAGDDARPAADRKAGAGPAADAPGNGAAGAAASGRRSGSGPVEATADPVDATTVVAGERGSVDRGGRSGPPKLLTVAAIAALVIALAAAAWFGAGWVRAAYFTDGPRAAARDAALDAAQQVAINMTSMNLDDVPGSLAIARSSMTGPILASATEHRQQAEAMATQAGVRMESNVLGAALTSLNSERDRASALVVLRVTEAKPGERPIGYRYTWSLDMAKEDDVWKAEQVASLGQPVPLNEAGTSPADPVAPGQGGVSPDSPAPGSGAAPAPGESGDAPAPGAPAQDVPESSPPPGETR